MDKSEVNKRYYEAHKDRIKSINKVKYKSYYLKNKKIIIKKKLEKYHNIDPHINDDDTLIFDDLIFYGVKYFQ